MAETRWRLGLLEPGRQTPRDNFSIVIGHFVRYVFTILSWSDFK